MTVTRTSEVVVDFQSSWAEMDLPAHVCEVLGAAPLVQIPENRQQLLDWALGRATGTTDWRLGNRDDHAVFEAVFYAPGQANGAGRVVEAQVDNDHEVRAFVDRSRRSGRTRRVVVLVESLRRSQSE